MSENKKLIRMDDPSSLAEFLKQPAIKIAEFITGLLVSETKDWKLSAGRLVQASIKSRLFTQLGKEIQEYIEKGKIKEDFLNEPFNQHSLYDLLNFIDEATPDEERFKAMKTLFFKSVFEDSSEQEKILSYQLMKLCKELESDDLLILKAAYNIYIGKLSDNFGKTNLSGKATNIEEWLSTISIQIGHKIKSLVEVHEDKLEKLKLLSPRAFSDRSGLRNPATCRLTDLGVRICEYIYNENLE